MECRRQNPLVAHCIELALVFEVEKPVAGLLELLAAEQAAVRLEQAVDKLVPFVVALVEPVLVAHYPKIVVALVAADSPGTDLGFDLVGYVHPSSVIQKR